MTFHVVIIGMGYVGIPAAALFADVPDFTVTGVQRRSKRSGWKIDALNAGKCPIGGDEPGLKKLIERVVLKKGTFTVTDDMDICREADAILIDVQTPTDENHIPQYVSLRSVSEQVGERMGDDPLIVIESTCAPGTTDYIVKPILEHASGKTAGEDFSLVFSYERVMVGRLLYNITSLPRIVGGIDHRSTERAVALYDHIVKEELIPSDALTAEVAKVTENTHRDVNIAFANEVALICESLGVDAYEVRKLVNTLPNIPSDPAKNPVRNMLFPGAGVGGHCLPKDPWLLLWGMEKFGRFSVDSRVIAPARRLNAAMPHHMAELTINALKNQRTSIDGANICLLGVAFLEDSDDTRNTPSHPLFDILTAKGAEVVIHDPYVDSYQDLPLTDDLEAATHGADAVVLVTKHKQYLDLDLDELAQRMRTRVLIDGRGVYDEEEVAEAGFEFRAVGRGHRITEDAGSMLNIK